MDDEICGVYITHAEVRYADKSLIGKPEGKRPRGNLGVARRITLE
jgi:hypothetical protein